jgi:hypothetical protein
LPWWPVNIQGMSNMEEHQENKDGGGCPEFDLFEVIGFGN